MIHSDQYNQTCEKCGEGKYKEVTLRDEIERTLHCTNCNHKVERWINVDNIDPEVEKRLTLIE